MVVFQLSELPHGIAFWLPVVFIIGAMVGSFLNVVIYRLPIMRWRREQGITDPPFNLAIPRSRCPACGHQISALENLPILSWLVLRGRCLECKAAIHWRYPVIELLTALAFSGVALGAGISWVTIITMLATANAIAMLVMAFEADSVATGTDHDQKGLL